MAEKAAGSPTLMLRARLLGRIIACAALALAVSVGVSHAQAQQKLVAGRNVNMVSGTQWPTGDPYLQRQNEPSVAASTRNPLHLVAGANDYRTVDIPGLPDGLETGDAWLGVFKSFDGGQRWQSTLLPGYPQDTSPKGMASPLKGYQAAADPVVRAGTTGLFYYSGLVFNRGASAPSAAFVARFIDNNNKENGDPIAYLGASLVAHSTGAGGTFIDKPWLAVDIPRSDARTCRITTPGPNNTPIVQQIKGGNLYVAYAVISGSGANIRSEIMFARSDDCGATWSRSIRLSRTEDKVNQGATIAIDPRTGVVYVAWRTFGLDESEEDSIMVRRSFNGGVVFDRPGCVRHFFARRKLGQLLHMLLRERLFEATELADISPFDQSTQTDAFRTNAYPTMAIDEESRVYLAWTERGFAPTQPSPNDGDTRIVMSTSRFGFMWSQPWAVDNPSSLPGHQLMPTLAYAGGKLVLVYYDLREDVSHTFAPWVREHDINPYVKRHTFDIRATQADPGDAPVFEPSVEVSEYRMGSRPGSTILEQLQYNPPNLPLFQQGSVPFMGDYIDVTPAPVFVQDNDGRWGYNTGASSTPVFHAVWTDNRDVRPPADGNWKNYTPPAVTGGQSKFDPSQEVLPCTPGQTGMRNQNIYTARLTGGLLAGSPGNAKPLRTDFPRAFVVFAQNTTDLVRSFRMTIVNQPVGGRASFSQYPVPPYGPNPPPPVTTLDVTIAPRSLVSRTVYVTSTNPDARVSVNVSEIAAPGAPTRLPSGLRGTVVLNPDISNPDISNPDISNPDISNADISNAEVYNPDISNPDISNPDISNPDISNPDISNPDISNPDISNPDISNPDISNPDISNPDISNPDISNPDISNSDISNGALTDTTWTVTNTGNTAGTFDVNLFLNQAKAGTTPICLPGQHTGCVKVQLILHRVYKTPVAQGCDLKLETHNVLVANIRSPAFNTGPVAPVVPDPTNPDVSNATMWIEPGGVAKITLRVVDPDPTDNVTLNPAADVTPVVTSEAVNTPNLSNPKAAPPYDYPSRTPATSTLLFVMQPANTVLGSAIAPVQVKAQAGEGSALAGVSISLAIGVNPSGGHLGGVTVAATDAAGVATFEGLQIDKLGTGYRLVASAGAIGAAPLFSNAFNVTPTTPPTQVRRITFAVPPTDAVGGQNMTPVVVRVTDQSGAVLPGVNVTMSIGASGCPASTLAGGTGVTNETGLATFPNLSINRGGWGYTLVASVGPGASVTSDAFDVEGFCDTASMAQPRADHTATALQDGRVLIVGGQGLAVVGGGSDFHLDAEIYDPATGTFGATIALQQKRGAHTATLLANGRVLVVGGSASTNTAEIFDPATNAFAAVAATLKSCRGDHTATLLGNTKVLIAGGCSLATAELYDPVESTFDLTGSMNSPRSWHTATVLADDRVLVTGGRGASGDISQILNTAEIYDPLSGTFRLTGSNMQVAREQHTATLLPDGRVLIAGGENSGVFLSSAEIYDPGNESFTLLGSGLNRARARHTATTLGSGLILIAGGEGEGTAELYDPATGTFRLTGSTSIMRDDATATLLADGRVLVTGGYDNNNPDGPGPSKETPHAEIFYPRAAASGSSPVIKAIVPSTAADGYGQLVTLQGSNLPVFGRALFAQGPTWVDGFIFQSPSSPTAVFVRLPIANFQPVLSPGPARVRLTDGAMYSNSAELTVSLTPGTPVLRSIVATIERPLHAPDGDPCGGGIASTTPITGVTSGVGGVAVSAFGTDTSGATVVFTQGTSVTEVASACWFSNATLGVASVVPVPTLTPGVPVTVQIRTTVKGVSSALSVPVVTVMVR
jgi:hypothetical protein